MTNLTLYEIMGEDMTLWAKLVNKKEVLVQVKDELERTVFEEHSHIYAWETLVSFAKQILAANVHIENQKEILE